MTNKAHEVKIKNYNSVSEFLSDYIEKMRKQNSSWTLTKWVNQLGLQATTSITMVAKNQRKCGKTIETALINFFDFDEADLKHFQYLVRKDKLPEGDPLKELIDPLLKKEGLKQKKFLPKMSFRESKNGITLQLDK